MFRYFRQRKENKAKAGILYNHAVAQGRLPIFYQNLGVPDTVDGRFEMIALHNYIIIHRLNKAGDVKLSQAVFDAFFKNMELSLREMGIGDLGVPKHMKRMMQGFHGRCHHYETAVKNSDEQELQNALIQNIYGTVENPAINHVKILADYVINSLKIQTTDALFDTLNIQEKEYA